MLASLWKIMLSNFERGAAFGVSGNVFFLLLGKKVSLLWRGIGCTELTLVQRALVVHTLAHFFVDRDDHHSSFFF